MIFIPDSMPFATDPRVVELVIASVIDRVCNR